MDVNWKAIEANHHAQQDFMALAVKVEFERVIGQCKLRVSELEHLDDFSTTVQGLEEDIEELYDCRDFLLSEVQLGMPPDELWDALVLAYNVDDNAPVETQWMLAQILARLTKRAGFYTSHASL